MRRRSLYIIMCFVVLLQFIFPVMNISAAELTKEQIVNNMTTEEKIAQLLMPAFRTYNGEKVTTLNSQIEELIAKRGFAGIILFAENNSSTEQTVNLIDAIQKANIKNVARPQLLISVDQEGAGVSRLAEGTQGPGNMALGATADKSNAYSIGEILGSELKAIGYNVDFAPVVDVNSNPANPVIGVRSFSDDPQVVSEFGIQFLKGLKSNEIITSLKHFPGHGDTSTDSHTGLPRIEKSYDELKQNELIPFINCIKNGAEMIMSAHIQFPKIETEVYTSIKDGSSIELPATLSKKIMNDILRNDLGFDGVIVTDAMNMKAISDNFNKLDSAKLAFNAGVDIILMPVDVLNEDGINELDKYISDVAALVDNGEISVENINKAVMRVLTLKENNNLLQKYSVEDIQSKINNAKSIVGSKANHDKEWDITKKAITLVKNDNNMLPILNNDKTVILVPYANEVLSGEYAIKKLKDDNIISDNMDISVFLIRGKEMSEIKDAIKDAKNVILITEQYSQAALAGGTYTTVDEIIDYVHEQGNKIACLSSYLPYDVARLQKADSILVGYSSKGMNELPNFDNGSVMTFGVSIPCGIYTAFDKNAVLGKLPVNIPMLDSEYKYKSDYLYQRNYGLQYSLKYQFISGENQSIDIAKFSQLSFEFDMDYNLFSEQGLVYIDDVLVNNSNYTLSDNTKIIFNSDYIKSLDVKEHILKLVVYNGQIDTKFIITKSQPSINYYENTIKNVVDNSITDTASIDTKFDDTVQKIEYKKNDKSSKNDIDSNQVTTDNSFVFVWIIIAIIICTGVVVFVVLTNRKKITE